MTDQPGHERPGDTVPHQDEIEELIEEHLPDEDDDSEPFVQTVTRLVTSAEILNINSQPVVLVDGILGTTIRPIRLYGGTVTGAIYNLFDGELIVTNGNNNLGYGILSSLFDGNNTRAYDATTPGLQDSSVDGNDLVLSINGASDNPEDGDASLLLIVEYILISDPS